jgi:hypothetical protein
MTAAVRDEFKRYRAASENWFKRMGLFQPSGTRVGAGEGCCRVTDSNDRTARTGGQRAHPLTPHHIPMPPLYACHSFIYAWVLLRPQRRQRAYERQHSIFCLSLAISVILANQENR